MSDPIDEPEPDLLELWHFPIAADRDEVEVDDGRVAGYYRDPPAVAQAIARLRGMPAFRDWPDGFRAYGVWLDEMGWTDGFGDWDDPPSYGPPPATPVFARGAVRPGMALYCAVHVRGGAAPDTKGLGVFSTSAHAAAAIAWARRMPGFCDWPDGFEVQVWRLDADGGPERIQ